MNNSKNTAICVLTYNRCDQLQVTLSCLMKEFLDFNCYVLNNASTDGTIQLLTHFENVWKQFRYSNSPMNLGCSKGRELLWKMSNCKYVLSLDDDVLLTKIDVDRMIRTIEKDERIGIVSPLIRDFETKRVLNPVTRDFERKNSLFFYEGCFLIRSSLFDCVGYFDPLLTIAGEGLDYSLRLRKAGYTIVRATDVCVEHVDRKRTHDDVDKRNQQWLWSFCYLYWKNESSFKAFFLSLRNFLAHCRTAIKSNKIMNVSVLMRCALSGSRKGYQNRYKIRNK